MTAPLRPWAAPELTSWNRLPMHAVRHRAGDLGVERIELDGTWAFELFPTPEQAQAAGPLATRVEVPGCWTLQDFDDVHGVGDLPHYTNVQMPWPGRPPHPPTERNPTGVYEREVEVPPGWAGRRVVLHVGAAESVLLVRVNGSDVGVGKDSHLASEFDVTAQLRPGEANVVRLTVVKWSDATFVEDQDQWWHGGLTRSVFLYATAPVHLAHVHVVADLATPDGEPVAEPLLEGATATGRLRVDVHVGAPGGEVPDGWSVRSVHLAGAAGRRPGGVRAPLAHRGHARGARRGRCRCRPARPAASSTCAPPGPGSTPRRRPSGPRSRRSAGRSGWGGCASRPRCRGSTRGPPSCRTCTTCRSRCTTRAVRRSRPPRTGSASGGSRSWATTCSSTACA